MRNDESHVTAGHGFDSAAFFVSPENTFLHWSVSGFFFFLHALKYFAFVYISMERGKCTIFNSRLL